VVLFLLPVLPFPISRPHVAVVAVSSFHNNWQFTNVLSLLILLPVLAISDSICTSVLSVPPKRRGFPERVRRGTSGTVHWALGSVELRPEIPDPTFLWPISLGIQSRHPPQIKSAVYRREN